MQTETQKNTLILKKQAAEHSALMLEKQAAEKQLQEKIHSLSLEIAKLQTELSKQKSDDEKTISDLKLQNQKLMAHNNQLKVGILQEETMNENVYEVDEIIDHKKKRDGFYFLVRWKDYTADDDCWVHESNLMCPKILKDYKKKMQI